MQFNRSVLYYNPGCGFSLKYFQRIAFTLKIMTFFIDIFSVVQRVPAVSVWLVVFLSNPVLKWQRCEWLSKSILVGAEIRTLPVGGSYAQMNILDVFSNNINGDISNLHLVHINIRFAV